MQKRSKAPKTQSDAPRSSRNRKSVVPPEWSKLLFLHDAYFFHFFDNKGVLEEFIETVTGWEGVSVVNRTMQKKFATIGERAAIIDAFCKTKERGDVIIEMQLANNDDHVKRVRFYAAHVTIKNSKSIKKFKELPDICVIYVTNFNFLGVDAAVAPVKRTLDLESMKLDPSKERLREIEKKLNNGIMEIYVNAKAKDGSKVARMLELISEISEPSSDEFPQISKAKEELLATEKGKEKMRYYEDAYTRRIRKEAQEKERERARKEREEGRKEGREEGFAELQEKQRALAKRLTEDNRSSEIPLVVTDPNFFNEQFAAYFPNGLPVPSK